MFIRDGGMSKEVEGDARRRGDRLVSVLNAEAVVETAGGERQVGGRGIDAPRAATLDGDLPPLVVRQAEHLSLIHICRCRRAI